MPKIDINKSVINFAVLVLNMQNLSSINECSLKGTPTVFIPSTS